MAANTNTVDVQVGGKLARVSHVDLQENEAVFSCRRKSRPRKEPAFFDGEAAAGNGFPLLLGRAAFNRTRRWSKFGGQ
jgi:hypothetical protein